MPVLVPAQKMHKNLLHNRAGRSATRRCPAMARAVLKNYTIGFICFIDDINRF